MTGDPNNVHIWAEADVWALKPGDIPAGKTIEDMLPDSPEADWPPAWNAAGLLNGDAGFEEAAEWDETEHPAWGYGVIKVGYKDFKMTRTFTTLEENPTVAYLRSRNDTATHVKVSKPADVYLGFETRDGEGAVKRRITCMPASVKYSGRNENESDLPQIEFESKIFPNSQRELFFKQDTGQSVTRTAVVTISGEPTGGTFKLEIEGAGETGPIEHDADGFEVEAALDALAAVEGVTVTGTAPSWSINYTATGRLRAGDNSLTGGIDPAVSVS